MNRPALEKSDDANRVAYEGPASSGLQAAGYGRLVPAGSATAAVTFGQPSTWPTIDVANHRRSAVLRVTGK